MPLVKEDNSGDGTQERQPDIDPGQKLEKRGIENKGLTDRQAGEIAFYAELHDAEWICVDNLAWVDLVISLSPWAWRKWFFTDEQGYPIYICFKFRR